MTTTYPTEIFKELTSDNLDALDVCVSTYNMIKMLDGLYDNDRTYTPLELATTLLNYTNTLTFNPFWKLHCFHILGIMQVASLAWVNSELNPESVYSDIIKSTYHEIYYYIGIQCLGFDKAEEVIRNLREYDTKH